MKFTTLPELLLYKLQSLYDAEQQILEALPELVEAARAQTLKDALHKHEQETEEQILRLERAADALGVELTEVDCAGIEGIIAEGQELLSEPSALQDIVILGSASKVEHYEMAAYMDTIALAQHLNKSAVVKELEQTLEEEENADETLQSLSAPLLSELG